MIGKTLAHYEVLAKIGAGGMGEVYRARDTKLGRDVAIKVLPKELSRDPERVARFRREARTLASLQHSHIASIFGFEDVGEERLLVMELVEGEDLGQRLRRGPLPVDEALDIARQIAEGFEAAHDQANWRSASFQDRNLNRSCCVVEHEFALLGYHGWPVYWDALPPGIDRRQGR